MCDGDGMDDRQAQPGTVGSSAGGAARAKRWKILCRSSSLTPGPESVIQNRSHPCSTREPSAIRPPESV